MAHTQHPIAEHQETWRTSNRAVVDSTNDFINTYGYDNLGRMTHVQQVEPASGNSVAEKRVDFAYNARGHFESITRWMDITQTVLVAATTFTYDDAHRLTGLSHDKGLTNLADYAWTYDTFGRLTSVTTVDGTDAYTYDDNGQLIDVDSTYQTDETFSYDANGNRTLAGYSTGDNNRLLSDGTSNYEYDAEGNRTKKTSIATGDYVEYAWDHRNRLTSVTFRTSGGVKTKEVQYTYDVYDRRIAKDVDDDGNGTIDRGERYVYDGSDIALVYDRSDSLVERLLYGPGTDQPLASEDGSGDVLWFLADNQGTVRDVAEYDDISGDTTVVNHIAYGGFGNITSQTDPSKEPRHTYTGREWDADSELFYYRARWYDPVVGRFISEDPIGFAAGDANLSRYVGNSTTNYVDPSGLFEWNVVGSAIVGFGQGLAQGAANLGNAFYEPFQSIGETGRAFGNSAVAYAEQFGDGSFDGGANDWGWFAAGFTSEVTGISGLDEVGRALGDRAVGIVENLGDGSFDGGLNDWGSFAAALAGEVTGLNKLYEAFSGKDLATCESLSTEERLQRGLTGALQAVLSAFGIREGARYAQRLGRPAAPAAPNATINPQKQAGHVPGTPQHINRVKQGKPTSTFHGARSGEKATQIANQRGTQVPGRPNVKEYDFGVSVGTGPNGGAQTRVRVHTSPNTSQIHGHPSGPEIF